MAALEFLVVRSVVNPCRQFLVGADAPATLMAGTRVTFLGLSADDLEHATPADREFLAGCCRTFLTEPTPEDQERIDKEVAAEKAHWASLMDPDAKGCSSGLRGFRGYGGEQ